MKILLVNNHTVHIDSLRSELVGHELEVLEYRPGVKFNDQDKDLVILSGGGGEGYELTDTHKPGHLWYEDEIDYVQRCKKPLLGICMGFEIICYTYGSSLVKQDRLLQGYMNINLSGLPAGTSQPKTLRQFESHNWHIENVSPKNFKVLADSTSGVEIIKHRNKKIWASQFHPEKIGGSWRLSSLVNQAACL